MGRSQLGGVEQWVLLVVLRLGNDGYALRILEELDREAGHTVTRGTLYKTLERLEAKGLLVWTLEDGAPVRGGRPRRLFAVTVTGLEALREGRARLLNLWDGVEGILESEA